MTSVSFKFSRQSRSKIDANSSSNALDDGEPETNEEPQSQSRKRKVVSLDPKGFEHAATGDKKACDKTGKLVIPALENSLTFRPRSANDRAKLALLDEAKKFKEGRVEVRKYDDKDKQVNIGEVVGELPDASQTNYDSVPIESFGVALLRGLGWNEGRPIGRTSSKIVKPWVSEPRPKGLGLGAAKSLNSSDQKSGKTLKEGDDELTFKKGTFVQIFKTGQYGSVLSVDNDNVRVFVKIKGESSDCNNTLNLSQYAVKIVSKGEYEKNKFPKTVSKHETLRLCSSVRKHKINHSWLCSDLKVRFIDGSAYNGKYYEQKMIINDIVSPEVCHCTLISSGKILENLHFTQFETVVPRETTALVKILSGKFKDHVAKIVERDSKTAKAIVQLIGAEEDKAIQFSFDDICEYVGSYIE